jgi:hypothetical protein
MTQIQSQQQKYQQQEIVYDLTPSADWSAILETEDMDDDDDIVCIINEEGRCSSCEE